MLQQFFHTFFDIFGKLFSALPDIFGKLFSAFPQIFGEIFPAFLKLLYEFIKVFFVVIFELQCSHNIFVNIFAESVRNRMKFLGNLFHALKTFVHLEDTGSGYISVDQNHNSENSDENPSECVRQEMDTCCDEWMKLILQ